MRTQSSDTHPKAEAVQIKLLQQAGPAKRLAMTLRMTHNSFALSLQNLKRLHPDWDEQTCKLELAKLLYGKELATHIQNHIQRRA